jgi:hypothetical protein
MLFDSMVSGGNPLQICFVPTCGLLRRNIRHNVIFNSGTDHMKRWLKIKSILEQIDFFAVSLEFVQSLIVRQMSMDILKATLQSMKDGCSLFPLTTSTSSLSICGRHFLSWILYSMSPSIISLKKDSYNTMVFRYFKMRPSTLKVTKLRTSSPTIRTPPIQTYIVDVFSLRRR